MASLRHVCAVHIIHLKKKYYMNLRQPGAVQLYSFDFFVIATLDRTNLVENVVYDEEVDAYPFLCGTLPLPFVESIQCNLKSNILH